MAPTGIGPVGAKQVLKGNLKIMERVTITFEGAEIQINEAFGGHTFTNDELETLATGGTVSFTANKKDGSGTYTANMKIGDREYNGKTFKGLIFDENKSGGGKSTKVSYNGQDAFIPKEFGGHVFTEDEIATLASGGVVDFEATKKSGGTYHAYMEIGEKEWQGKTSLGLVFAMPQEFCQHKFTEDELTALKNGDSIICNDLVSKKGSTFTAALTYKNGKFDMQFE